MRSKDYDALAGVILGLTGSEAMLASRTFTHSLDLSLSLFRTNLAEPSALLLPVGQFNPASIRTGFGLVYVSVVLAYFGQAAKLIARGSEVLPSLFYLTIPGGVGGPMYWIMFVAAILACLSESTSSLVVSRIFADDRVRFDDCSRVANSHHGRLLACPATRRDGRCAEVPDDPDVAEEPGTGLLW